MDEEYVSIGLAWLFGLLGVAAIVFAIGYAINLHDKAETKKVVACVSNGGQWARNGATHECLRGDVDR